jgi:hypothetical protein
VSTIEELLERKSSGSDLKSRECSRRDPPRWQRDTLYPQKLALSSPTSCGYSVGIVRSLNQATELNITDILYCIKVIECAFECCQCCCHFMRSHYCLSAEVRSLLTVKHRTLKMYIEVQLHTTSPRFLYSTIKRPLFPLDTVAYLVEALCYKTKGRVFETPWGEWFFSIYLVLPAALGPGIYSASNRNEHHKQKNNVSGG